MTIVREVVFSRLPLTDIFPLTAGFPFIGILLLIAALSLTSMFLLTTIPAAVLPLIDVLPLTVAVRVSARSRVFVCQVTTASSTVVQEPVAFVLSSQLRRRCFW